MMTIRRALALLALPLFFCGFIVSGGVLPGATPSYVGPCDSAVGGACTFYFGTAAATAADAAATPNSYDCNGTPGTPTPGAAVAITTSGYVPNTSCSNVTYIYQHGGTIGPTACHSSSPCDLSTPVGTITVVASAQNGHACFHFATNAYIHSVQFYTQVAEPQGLSMVAKFDQAGATALWTLSTNNAEPAFYGLSSTFGMAVYDGSSAVQPAVAASTTAYVAWTGSVNGATSNITWKTSGGTSTGSGTLTSSVTSGDLAWGDLDLAASYSSCEAIMWDNDTAWSGANYATTAAAVLANQISRWGL